jgi:outer membrane protein OmpA-like peptidoglycan-associated protein
VATKDPKTAGCPSDRDKDGILDADDACPDNAGPPDRDPRKNGCPMAYVKEGQIRILEAIEFVKNSAELDPGRDTVLEAVTRVLREHPEIPRIRIEGHTDNQGSTDGNLAVSKKRARAVMTWLVKHGVAAARLDSQGYGPARPISDNATDEGRSANRRIEFHVVADEAPTP